MSSLKEMIDKLPELKIFVEQSAESILTDLKLEFKGRHPDVELIESGSILMQLENTAYRKAFHNVALNNKIKEMLPHYCQNDDLDNFIFGFYGGEQRHLGEEPTAPYEFKLEEPLSNDVIIPKGFILSDKGTVQAYLMANVIIAHGELSAEGKVKLDLKVKESDIKTETPISTFPHVVTVKALDTFKGGSSRETDEEFFERAILSLNKYSTAGGKKAYIYFCKLADERVFDVKVISPAPLLIDLYILATNNESEVLDNVRAVQGSDRVQAFCDVVDVKAAIKKEVTLTPNVYLLDLLQTASVDKEIQSNFTNKFKIGESFPYSKAIKALEVANVYEVVMDAVDLSVQPNEYLSITVTPNYVEASL
ncbi:baseplate J/gp47 family protein [Arcobacter sp.]|uniref:baseplate J/gp47 family protein n=1 Tax=unclassified Arcobacter TaxID=2593671 RepID=UPI003AFFDD3A